MPAAAHKPAATPPTAGRKPWWSRTGVAVSRLALMLTVLVALGTAVHAQPHEGGLEGLNTRLSNLEAAVSRLKQEYANPIAVMSKHPIQRRLIDARVYYELGHFESAAILMLDVMHQPGFRANREYQPTAMLLGECLAALKNFTRARHYLNEALKGPEAKVTDAALYFLFDMALDANDKVELQRLVGVVSSVSSDRTRYVMGKALFQLDRYDQALVFLRGIRLGSPFYKRARYYIGVLLTAQKAHADALAVFSELTGLEPENDDERLARDLALLARGRLLMSLGRGDEAAAAYQRVDRNSQVYEVALYEMAWSYTNKQQYQRALQIVDILLLVVKDGQLDVEAHVLRGRLAMMMNDYDRALESYERIVKRFAPIGNELIAFSRDPTNIDRYFAWLLERHTSAGSLKAPLTERTSRWLESNASLDRLVKVFSTLGAQRQELVETRELASDLERIVSSPNRVERFPHLKEGWTRALALQNQLLTLSSAMLDEEFGTLGRKVAGNERDELEEMVEWRRKLEARLRRMPMTFEQYETRQGRVDERYLDLQRKSFLVEQTLKELRKQLLAIEKYVNNKQYADRGRKLSEEREKELRAAIGEEKQRMQALYDEFVAVKKQIRIEAERIGTGDTVTQTEANLRQTLIAAHKREALHYERVLSSPTPDQGRELRQYADYRQRLWRSIDGLRNTIRLIDSRVSDRTREIRKLVEVEKGQLERYGSDMSGQENAGRDIARAVGEQLFVRAKDRMKQVVLEADVGLIDVAWHRKAEKTDKIRRLSQDRADRLTRLEKESRRLLQEAEPDEDGEDEKKAKDKAGDKGDKEDGGESGDSGDKKPEGASETKDKATPKTDGKPKPETSPKPGPGASP